MLPMLGVPTTAGTGSEAQSYAVLSDAETHAKMACGAPGAAFRVALLDPELTVTAPPAVTAAAGIDAVSHAVETWVTTRRSPLSDVFAREAWRLLSGGFVRVITTPDDIEARGAMQLGAFYAGLAIEQSMLGATHACANPLTRRYGTAHGVAISLLLPHVVRWNSRVAADRYAELAGVRGETRRPELLVGANRGSRSRPAAFPAACPPPVCRSATCRTWRPRRRSSGPGPSIRGSSTSPGRWRFTRRRTTEIADCRLQAAGRLQARRMHRRMTILDDFVALDCRSSPAARCRRRRRRRRGRSFAARRRSPASARRRCRRR